jgi:hypothetical protein
MKIPGLTAKWLVLEQEDVDGWLFVEEVEGELSRWRQYRETIIKRLEDGTFWSIGYERALTDNCDNSFPWENWGGDGLKDVDIYQVYPHEVTTRVWSTKKPTK